MIYTVFIEKTMNRMTGSNRIKDKKKDLDKLIRFIMKKIFIGTRFFEL